MEALAQRGAHIYTYMGVGGEGSGVCWVNPTLIFTTAAFRHPQTQRCRPSIAGHQTGADPQAHPAPKGSERTEPAVLK